MPDFPTGLHLDEARARMAALGAARPLARERIALGEALGRVLAHDVDAPFDLPPFANSAMDGFAVRAADVQAAQNRLRIVGTRYAGDGAPIALGAGECVRLTTGAPVPTGADTIAIKENVRVEGEIAVVAGPIARGTHYRPAGEDIARGERIMQAGEALSAGHLGVLAACGLREIQVAARPRVAVLTTGDEVIEPPAALQPGQIYNSNRHSLAALLQAYGVASLRHAHVRDDPAALRAALAAAADGADLVLSSGGVSAGEADFLPGLLRDMGEVYFWKVRMRPGMPVLVGCLGGALVTALPGNPVSTMATFLALVRPALDAMAGRAPRARHHAALAVPVRKTHVRAEYLRARCTTRADGLLQVTPLPKQGSGMLHGMLRADCLALIPEEATELPAGAVVELLPLGEACGGALPWALG